MSLPSPAGVEGEGAIPKARLRDGEGVFQREILACGFHRRGVEGKAGPGIFVAARPVLVDQRRFCAQTLGGGDQRRGEAQLLAEA
jgi:hypothetical protein